VTAFDLSGTTALVTGCRRGIGRAAALALAGAGANIIGVSAALEADGGEVGNAVTGLGRRFDGYQCDFADREALYAFIADVSDAFPRIDILVLNAGTIARKAAIEHDDAMWDRVLQVNLTAQFVLAREFGRRMVEQRRGKIVFVASLLAFQGGVTVPGYAASKGGVAQLTKALANEWAALGVNVNAIAPGYIRTDNNQALQDDETRSRQILDRIPAGRWGVPDDLGAAFVFLAAPASDYVHGIVLPVDGGWLGR
jgi:2-deoxy-D-gluconate 3-dehydrogenase